MVTPHSIIPQWKSRPVFISSTFRDMHAERDHLRNFVLPRLEEELHKRRYHLEWIDLRQGVEFYEAGTEEQRELQILRVCLAEIKRSRPFLIVLLGDRYGWVPPGDRMEVAAREAGFPTDTTGKSVTALEIEFGIFKESPTQQHRCFFYLREPLPYEKLPTEFRADYSERFATDDGAAARNKALNELKARLASDSEIKPRIRTYEADWDAEKMSVTGLEAWGNQVFEDLWQELEAETRLFAERKAPTWEEVERAALGEFIERVSRDFTGREETIQQLYTFSHSPTAERAAWGLCITGSTGSGKSALFAKLHRKLESDANILLLSNAAGATMRGSRVDSMLHRWIAELSAFLDVENPLKENATIDNVDLAFASLLENASLKKRVVVLLDALDQFEPTPRAKHLTWRPKPWPANARLIATAVPGEEAELYLQFPDVYEIKVPPLTEADAQSIARRIWKRLHVPWSDAVWQTIADKKLSYGTSAISNPLWTTLAWEQLALLDAYDFARIERQNTGDIQARMIQLRCDLADRMSPDVPGLYKWLLTKAEKIHGAALVSVFVCAIVLSRHGWRESDLQVLITQLDEVLRNGAGTYQKNIVYNAMMARAFDRFDSNYTPSSLPPILPVAELAVIRRTFGSSLILRNELQWDFLHNQARVSFRKHLGLNSETETAIHQVIAAFLIQQRNDDPVRCDEITFHLIEAEEYETLQIFYGSTSTTHQRELAAATATLVDVVNSFGMKRLIQISNIDVNLQVFDSDGNPVSDFDEKFEFSQKDIRRDIAKGWIRQCMVRLLPKLRSVATVEECNRFVNLMHSRLSDSEKDFPHDRELRVSNALMKGDLEKECGNLDAARSWYGRARHSAQQESATFAIACDKLGDLARAASQFAEARTYYKQALPIFRKLALEDWNHRRDLSLCLSKLGELALDENNLAEASSFFDEHLVLAKEIAASESSYVNYQRDLSGAHSRLQRLAMTKGDTEKALHHAREAHKIVKDLADLDPGDVTNIQDLAGSTAMLGKVLILKGDKMQAIQCLLESAATVKVLAGTAQLDAKGRHLLVGLANYLFKLDELETASSLASLAAFTLTPQDPFAEQFVSVAILILDKMMDQKLNEEAEKLCDCLLPFCKKIHGECSRETVVLFNCAGILRKRKDELNGAEHFYRRAYEEICKLEGPESPGAQVCLGNLAWVLKKKSQNKAESSVPNAIAVDWSRHRAHEGPIYAIVHSPTEKVFVTGGFDQLLKIWPLEGDQPIQAFKAHEKPITGAAFTGDGERIVTCSWDRRVKLWQLDGQKLIGSFENSNADFCAVALSASGDIAYVACEDGSIKVWDFIRGTLIRAVQWHRQAAVALALSRKGDVGVSGGSDGTVRVWDPRSMEGCCTVTGHDAGVNAVAIASDGRLAVSGGADNLVLAWDLERREIIHAFKGHIAPVSAVVLSPDGKRIGSASLDGTVRLWDLSEPCQLACSDLGDQLWALAATTDLQTLMAGDHSGFIHRGDVGERDGS